MRRSLGLVLVVLGAFLATLAPLIRFYVSSQVIQAPLNRYERVRLEAANASVFDMATLKVRKGMTLVADTTIRGDVKANGGNGRIAVWDSSTTITDKSTGKQIDLQAFRMAFDRRTAQLVNCCAANVGGDVNVKMFGYGLLYPIADVHRRDYPFYDTTTRRTLPMKYTGDEELNGIDTYKFVQQVPLAKVETMDVKLPGDMLGLGKNAYPQHVDRYFEAVNTQWVDPRTGIPVKHEQKITQSLRTRTAPQADRRGRRHDHRPGGPEGPGEAVERLRHGDRLDPDLRARPGAGRRARHARRRFGDHAAERPPPPAAAPGPARPGRAVRRPRHGPAARCPPPLPPARGFRPRPPPAAPPRPRLTSPFPPTPSPRAAGFCSTRSKPSTPGSGDSSDLAN